jgi:hypothetical protein
MMSLIAKILLQISSLYNYSTEGGTGLITTLTGIASGDGITAFLLIFSQSTVNSLLNITTAKKNTQVGICVPASLLEVFGLIGAREKLMPNIGTYDSDIQGLRRWHISLRHQKEFVSRA